MRKKKLLFLGFFLVNILGCTHHLSEGIKGFLGISTRILEEKRVSAEKKTFDCNYEDCLKLTKDFLKETKSYIYCRKPKMLAIYLSETDTTPIGIFFEPEDNFRTRIEVSSPSSFVKEEFSQKLFTYLEQELTLRKFRGEK